MEHVRLRSLNCSELRKVKFGNGTMHSKCATNLGFFKRGVGGGCESRETLQRSFAAHSVRNSVKKINTNGFNTTHSGLYVSASDIFL
jgi:hypothetical protein